MPGGPENRFSLIPESLIGPVNVKIVAQQIDSQTFCSRKIFRITPATSDRLRDRSIRALRDEYES